MTFFNKKEEVLDIQLTQYGKHLLSMGKFKPVYYQFFDDDVIYDSQYAGIEDELQKDIEARIKEVPRPHTQYTFAGAEKEIRRQPQSNPSNMWLPPYMRRFLNPRKGTGTDYYIPYNLKHRILTMPLGNSEVGKQTKPAWNIRSLRRKFSDTITFITGTYSNLKIPRLTLENIEFKLTVASDNSGLTYTVGDSGDTISDNKLASPTSNFNNLSSRFEDNTFIQVQEDYILLDLRELNTEFEQENFEIEIYSVENDQFNQEVLTQLFFNKKNQHVVNNILVDAPRDMTDFKPNRNEMIETFFLIKTDREINSQIMCENLSFEEKQYLVATNQLDLDCKELYGTLTDPRIQSDVRPEDLEEKC